MQQMENRRVEGEQKMLQAIAQSNAESEQKLLQQMKQGNVDAAQKTEISHALLQKNVQELMSSFVERVEKTVAGGGVAVVNPDVTQVVEKATENLQKDFQEKVRELQGENNAFLQQMLEWNATNGEATTEAITKMAAQLDQMQQKIVSDVANRFLVMEEKNKNFREEIQNSVAPILEVGQQLVVHQKEVETVKGEIRRLNNETDTAVGVIVGRLQEVNAAISQMGPSGAPEWPRNSPDVIAAQRNEENVQLRAVVQATRTEMRLMQEKMKLLEKGKYPVIPLNAEWIKLSITANDSQYIKFRPYSVLNTVINDKLKDIGSTQTSQLFIEKTAICREAINALFTG